MCYCSPADGSTRVHKSIYHTCSSLIFPNFLLRVPFVYKCQLYCVDYVHHYVVHTARYVLQLLFKFGLLCDVHNECINYYANIMLCYMGKTGKVGLSAKVGLLYHSISWYAMQSKQR